MAARLIALLAFAAVVLATSPRFVMEDGKGGELIAGWEKLSVLPNPKQELKLVVALKNRNLDKFDELFWKITDPKNAMYGKYLTVDQLADLTAPPADVIADVQKWLFAADMSVEGVSRSRDFIHVSGTVAAIEKMLDTKFAVYKHSSGSLLTKASRSYSVPSEMAPHIDYIAGVIGLAKVRQSRIAENVNDAFLIGPTQLRARYNVTTIGSGRLNNSYAVAEFQGQYYSPQDLDTFFQKYVSYSTNDTVYKVVGTNNANAVGIEAELDIQYIMGVAPNVQAWFYSNPSFDFWTDLTAWTALLANESNIPWVHSISYGDQGEFQPSESYKESLCTQFQKLGARGVSIIFASGDSGTGCDLCVRFQSSFPATCPYVTSVGATQFISGTSGPEAAVSQFGSGGGFSKSFKTPPFQQGITEAYLNSTKDLPPFFYYDKDGRGTPDVAALGIGFAVVVDGQVQSVGGTSCAAPTFSAIVSLLNEIRFAAGKPSMGFLNNWIYQTYQENPGAWWDVTQGSNQDGCCLKGFPCAKGWDPVTGVGTANFAILKTLV